MRLIELRSSYRTSRTRCTSLRGSLKFDRLFGFHTDILHLLEILLLRGRALVLAVLPQNEFYEIARLREIDFTY